MVSMHQYEQIDGVVCFLLQEFVNSPKLNFKNGGMMGLAAVAVALGPQHIHLQGERLLCGAVTGVFAQGMSTRQQSCESLYNIIKVLRDRALEHAPVIFEILIRVG